MSDAPNNFRALVRFAGFVLIVAILRLGQAILVPIAVALLLTFVLSPLVVGLQRRIGRVPAVISVVACTFAVLGLVGWGFARQMTSLAKDLPHYRDNIRQKIEDIQGLGKGGSVEKVQTSLNEIKQEMAQADAARSAEQPLVVSPKNDSLFPAWIDPFIGPAATAGLVVVLVIFMLLERQEFRGRIIRAVGHGHLTITTRAFDEAAQRVSRFLLMQSLVNLTFGVGMGIGLFVIGVPYALVWGALAGMLRFIPYVGSWVAAGAPFLLSLAVSPTWTQPLWVAGLFVGLELFIYLVIEPFLYSGAAGVSPLSLLISIAFWTWLWGPPGLLLATPMTVCLVVLGNHIPSLKFVSLLMADDPSVPINVSFYQRLLARDQGEASDLIERYIKTEPPETVYDVLLLPALNYAERDYLDGLLSTDEETAVVEATRELAADTASLTKNIHNQKDGPTLGEPATSVVPVAMGLPAAILGYPVNTLADEVALHLLIDLLEGMPILLEIASGRLMASEIVAAVGQHGYRIVCLADLPPKESSKTRYLIKKLRSAYPDLKIVVGRWATPTMADDTDEPLLRAGADYVDSKLTDTCEHLRLIGLNAPVAGS